MIKWFCFSFFFLLSIVCRAAEDSLGLLHLTIENGLPSNNVYMAIQDRKGYTWIATDNGVVKYNGYDFRVFTTSDGLPSNDIWRVYEDKKGRIWLFSNTYQLGYLSGDVFRAVRLSRGSSLLKPREIADNGEVVLLAYYDKSMCSTAIIGKEVAHIFDRYDFLKINVRQYAVCNDFSVWMVTYDKKIYRYSPLNPKPLQLVSCNASQELIIALMKATVIEAHGNMLYGYAIGTNFLDVFDVTTCKYWKLYLDKNDPSDKITVGEMFQDRIQVVTGKYIYTINNGSGSVQSRIELPSYLRSILTYYYAGNNGAKWYCTSTDGIWYKPGYSMLREKIKYFNDARTLAVVGAFSDKTFWWDSKSSEMIISSGLDVKERIRFPGLGKLLTVQPDKAGDLYLLFNDGIYRYHVKQRELLNFFSDSRPLVVRNYNMYGARKSWEQMDSRMKYTLFWKSERVEQLADSTYLLFNWGIVHRLSFQRSRILSDILVLEKTSGFLRDTINKFIAIYNQKNIIIFDRRWKKLELNSDILKSMGLSNVLNILKDPYGNFLIHCEDRIFRFNLRTLQGNGIRTNFNLSPSSTFLWKNYLIVVGNFGVSYAAIGPNSIGRFRLLPNIRNSSFNRINSCSMDGVGNIYMLTDKGTFYFAFDSLQKADRIFSFDKDSMFHFRLKFPYQRQINQNDTLVISQPVQSMVLDAINYFGSASQQYHYKIAGHKWRASPSGEIFLNDMAPGKFHKIQYYVQDAHWTGDLMTLYIYKPLWWYQTTLWKTVFWFTGVILFVLSLVLASFATRRYVAVANEKKRWQTELELRAIHAQINPHFIFNTLSTALYYISKKRSEEAYEHVSGFSKLLRAYLKSSRERLIRLSDEIEMLDQYIRLQNKRFSKPFHYEISVDPAIVSGQLLIPSLLIQPLVENAINHGLFHKGENGILLINFKKGGNETELICSIDDNGVGRERVKDIQRNRPQSRESYGSDLTRELIDVFQKYEQMDISIAYIDKQLPETGTIVRLVIRNIKTG